MKFVQLDDFLTVVFVCFERHFRVFCHLVDIP